ncbi:MAG: EAL domain-containing protein, partial [Clostridiales bacterium]|nr:EAL domain-containing protein [Clostridiales bacterium]
FSIFDNNMEEKLNYKSLITDVLRYAINNNEIYLLYQPQISLKNNQIIGFEALMRIYHPRMGLISPSEFIPVAEETGLINELGEWALRKACEFNKSLIDSGIPPYIVDVNISPVQLNHYNFFDKLSQILEETQLPPKYLELELTESTLVSSIIDTATIIKRLQNIGVKVALDDFGTGYSSLNYLAKMDIHTLKIDKSFINNICVNEKDLSMVHTIIRLAHNLGIQVVAEGVEHPSQLVLLKEKKCDIIQGFVFSQPLLSNDLMHLLQSTKT